MKMSSEFYFNIDELVVKVNNWLSVESFLYGHAHICTTPQSQNPSYKIFAIGIA